MSPAAAMRTVGRGGGVVVAGVVVGAAVVAVEVVVVLGAAVVGGSGVGCVVDGMELAGAGLVMVLDEDLGRVAAVGVTVVEAVTSAAITTGAPVMGGVSAPAGAVVVAEGAGAAVVDVVVVGRDVAVVEGAGATVSELGMDWAGGSAPAVSVTRPVWAGFPALRAARAAHAANKSVVVTHVATFDRSRL